MDDFGYLIPKSGPSRTATRRTCCPSLEISCPSAGSGLSAYLEFGVSVDSLSRRKPSGVLLPGRAPKPNAESCPSGRS